jgi:hypothetical protein
MTQINYPDIVRSSPDGQLRLEICSPDNDEVSPRIDPDNHSRNLWGGFQRDFAFVVRRADSGDIVWQRGPDTSEELSGPCNAWVSDSGHVVLITRHTFHSELIVLRPGGDIALRCDVAKDILENNESELHWTSAGPCWDEHGHGLFFHCGAVPYWCIRTRLGRQVVVNLDGFVLEKSSARIAKDLAAAQRSWTLRTVQEAAADTRLFCQDDAVEWPDHWWEFLSTVWTAVWWSGSDRVAEAIPALRALEESTVWSSSTSGWPMPPVEKTLLVPLYLVPVVKNSLRCLGQEPKGRAGYWLCTRGEADDRNPTRARRIEVPECLPDRAMRLNSLRLGMPPHEVVSLVGMPDLDWQGWDYDELTGEHGPSTLHLDWSLHMTAVERIERRPPGWLELSKRAIWL